MIPSSPRRTWIFLGASCLLYFAPDLLLPVTWQQASLYPILSAAYQGGLLLLGFALAPAICRAMVEREIAAGPLRTAVDQALAPLHGLPLPQVVVAEHDLPFILTAGLLPRHCQVYVSSALVGRLSLNGLRFLLARAAVHASLRQRLAALLPVLGFTVLLPNDYGSPATWYATAGFLGLWLLLHWFFELDADRRAARMMGPGASEGLHEVVAATATPLDRLSPRPPLHWRLRAVADGMPTQAR